MTTYHELFDKVDRPVLIPFFVLGDPDSQRSLELIKVAIDAGADVLELGIPFSDPIADGPTIQKADIRALNKNINCKEAFDIIRQIRQYSDVPIGLLMYYNIICKYGPVRFYHDAANAGVNSVLIADLCIDDAEEVSELLKKYSLDSVYMVTPNTSPDRQKKIAELCSGFIYTVSLTGVTGTRNKLSDKVVPLIASLKSQTSVPVCVGFGVSKPEHAKALAQAGADGVIVGSAIVNIIEKNLDTPEKAKAELETFIRDMKAVL